jgi:hypothetical protein
MMKILIKSVRGECFPFAPSIHRTLRGTRGERKMYRTMYGLNQTFATSLNEAKQ